jgi:hypothetical protein
MITRVSDCSRPYLKLKRARKEGRLAEALLDRRAKLKRFVAYHLTLHST